MYRESASKQKEGSGWKRKHVPIHSNFRMINKIQFLKLPQKFYILGNRKEPSKQTPASVGNVNRFPLQVFLVSHCLYTPPVHSARNASPNSRLKQPFSDSSV